MFLPQKSSKNNQGNDSSTSYVNFSKRYIKSVKTKKSNKTTNNKTDNKLDIKFDNYENGFKYDQALLMQNHNLFIQQPNDIGLLNQVQVQNQSQNQGNQYNPNQKNQIIDWLFSLSKTDRMKALTIESKWLANNLIMMQKEIQTSEYYQFKLKEDNSNNSDGINYNNNGYNTHYNNGYNNCYNNGYCYSNGYPYQHYSFHQSNNDFDFTKKADYNTNPKYYLKGMTNLQKYENKLINTLRFLNLKGDISNAMLIDNILINSKSDFENIFNELTENKFLCYNIK
jgi:hypothetical protein